MAFCRFHFACKRGGPWQLLDRLRSGAYQNAPEFVQNHSSKSYYEQVVRQRHDPFAFERAKIEYLIERIRFSELTFLRDRVPHTAKEAANHLAMKLYRAGDRIRSARDFIKYIATRSILSGKLYLVRLMNGKTYPAKDVFSNELETLEAMLAHETPAN